MHPEARLTQSRQAPVRTFREGGWDRALQFIWLEVTSHCNLECVHCYADSGPDKPLMGSMSFNDWVQLLQDAAAIGCRNVQFIGGEPTLYPHLRDLVSQARTLGYGFVEVYTNGAGLTEPMCAFLHAHDVRLAFSLYGASPDVHDKVTKRAGSFNRTLQRIRSAVAIGLPVRVGVNPMEQNEYDVEPTSALLRSIGVTEIRVDRVRGLGRGDKMVQASDPLHELCGACWQGQLAVDMNGDAYPCVFSKFRKIGNIREGLSDLLAKPELTTFRHQVRALDDERSKQNAAGCNPYCNPNCNPFKGCNPHCLPW